MASITARGWGTASVPAAAARLEAGAHELGAEIDVTFQLEQG